MNIQKAILEGASILKKNKISSPNLDSEILLSKVINRNREYIILNSNKNLSKKKLGDYKKLIKQRSLGKPVAYLTSIKSFWKNEFVLSEGVLIPRPDTETMIEEVLNLTKHKYSLNILDIGSGSGCILLSILNEKKNFSGIGIDVSKKCIELCKINTKKLGLSNRVKFYKSDVDNFNYGKYDLIISNPPYIKKAGLKYLEKDVFCYEPSLALNGGLDGLSAIRKIINKSSELIKKNGKLILEIAFDQKEKVKELLNKKGFYINKVLKDIAKNDRCIISTKI